jgi:hypothetical protein
MLGVRFTGMPAVLCTTDMNSSCVCMEFKIRVEQFILRTRSWGRLAFLCFTNVFMLHFNQVVSGNYLFSTQCKQKVTKGLTRKTSVHTAPCSLVVLFTLTP